MYTVVEINPTREIAINFMLYLQRKRPRGIKMKRAIRTLTLEKTLKKLK